MMRLALFLCALLVTLPALGQDSRPTSRPAKPTLPPLGAPAGVFGEGVKLEEATPLAAVVEDPEAFHGKVLRIEGTIADVCQAKGCWMVLRTGDREVRVKFAGYAFFVPRDAHERQVLVQGTATRKTISEELARHYAEESGHPERAKEIHGPQQVIEITATGVEVLGRDALPPEANGTPEAAAALRARVEQGRALLGKAEAPPATPAQALALLRQLPGARTRELSLRTEVDGWHVFAAADVEEAFSAGYAVNRATGRVVVFGPETKK